MATLLKDLLDEMQTISQHQSALKDTLVAVMEFSDIFSESSIQLAKEGVSEIDRIAGPFIRSVGLAGEKRTCAAFDALCLIRDDTFINHHSRSPVITLHREYSFPCGRVDRLLKHEDGSITLVEVKQQGSRRDICTAIGQILMYGAAAKQLIDGATDYHLSICVSGDRDKWIEAACDSAGIGYLNIDKQTHLVLDAITSGYMTKQ